MFQLRLVPSGTNIPFIAWRRLAMSGSAVLVVLSLILAFVPGLNFGIDFRGGILIEVQTHGPADLGEMRSKTGSLGLGEVSLQEFGADDTVFSPRGKWTEETSAYLMEFGQKPESPIDCKLMPKVWAVP